MMRMKFDRSNLNGFYFTEARNVFAGLYYRTPKKKLSV